MVWPLYSYILRHADNLYLAHQCTGDFDGGFFSSTPSYFLLFVAIVVPLVGGIGVSFANFLPPSMISFEYENKRGIMTSFTPFYIHW